MSAKSRNRNRNKNHHAAESSINTAIHEISTLSQQLTNASPFEEAQLQHIQTMTEHLAGQVLSTMKQKDESNPNAALPLFRIYAQYLNLYMKFKDKCFKNATPQPPHSSSTHKPPLPLQPLPANNAPGDERLSCQIRDAIQRVIHKTEPNRLHSINTTNALLMPAANGSESQKT